jgi:hypothetical protein
MRIGKDVIGGKIRFDAHRYARSIEDDFDYWVDKGNKRRAKELYYRVLRTYAKTKNMLRTAKTNKAVIRLNYLRLGDTLERMREKAKEIDLELPEPRGW